MPNDEFDPLKVVAIVQARMGSRRFPGKVLAELHGRPVLEWVVDAVKRVEGVHERVVATTTNPEDAAIQNWCQANGVNFFRGDPLDVLRRYSDCARFYQATHVVRITADCPFLDPETVSTVLRQGLASRADYFGLSGNFPDGFDCEGFSTRALEFANINATEPLDREHVTMYFKSNPGLFRTKKVELYEGQQNIRLTIDYKSDLEVARSILRKTNGITVPPEALFELYRDVLGAGAGDGFSGN